LTDADTILGTLSDVAERHGDPTALIYGKLFAAHPALEPLFGMDRDGGVRASMVQQAFECILDYLGPRLTAPQIIASSRQHHDGYGVPAARFDDFFISMRDAIREIMAERWTPAMEREWAGLLREFAAIR
jgi:hypothetical protein